VLNAGRRVLDYDDIRADDELAESVASTGILPELAVECGLAAAMAAYRTVATHQAHRGLMKRLRRGRTLNHPSSTIEFAGVSSSGRKITCRSTNLGPWWRS
jgi:hypothetical protein